MPQADAPFSYMCVCSDQTVASTDVEDDFAADISYIGVPVTTDPEKI